MGDYSQRAKVYWWMATSVGLLALAMALLGIARMPSTDIPLVLTGALMAAIAGLFSVRIPGTKVSASAAEIFVFLLLLSFGPDAAVAAAAAEAAVISWRTSARWTSRIGSPAMAALAMYACSYAFVWSAMQLPVTGGGGIGATLPLLPAAALLYFAVGTLLMASLLRLKRSEPVRPLALLGDHAWLGLAYACSAAVAGLLHSSFGRFEFAIVLAAAPLTAVLLAMLHFYYRHVPARQP